MNKTILFDVDGTLIDTEKTIIKSFQKNLNDSLGVKPAAKDLFYILGIPGTKAIERFTKDPKESKKLLDDWAKNDQQMFHYTKLFAGIEQMLQLLKNKGVQLGIVTSRTDREMQIVLDNFDLKKYFDVFITASKTKLHKPNPEPILKAIETLKIDPINTLYIGDSIYDFKCAKNAEVEFALASWGAKEKPEFSKVDYFLKRPTDLVKIL
ncbi:HAD-IA family hydrolase [Lactobacillus halodurans]|uniref:HAD-IA family hydrolase n=1 Tax=Companilactobacillus halodurans TaxID=2584183 RepID=A0A5P0ZNE1_9LACO|nr:HAD-IA family hydrolase [Companilactobacillus halodurans]MQS75692.1 HAD-IA family hydrolase [Companilactobacillus halodurans]